MLRTSIYASIWVLLITIALVGTNMYFNPAITLSSLQQDKAVVEKAADDATKAQVHHELRINIGKLKNDRGQLIAQLYGDATAFNNNQYQQAVHTVTTPAKGFKGSLVLPPLPAGTYAVVVIHDENMNQDYDSKGSFMEGYAYSNNVGQTQLVTFSQAAFKLQQAKQQLQLELIYH